MAEGRLCNIDGLILTAMVLTEFSNVGVNTLVKSVTSKGLSPFVVLVYSYAFGSLLLLPLAFFSFRFSSFVWLCSQKFDKNLLLYSFIIFTDHDLFLRWLPQFFTKWDFLVLLCKFFYLETVQYHLARDGNCMHNVYELPN